MSKTIAHYQGRQKPDATPTCPIYDIAVRSARMRYGLEKRR
jgi:hypothetical protein